ncbi:arginine deiminase [Hathewaya limosa]|uniref:Arginine deiminase n=1 Tax=Hathewaya limosa TaxID=1536 RepID=A0ABU0JTE8_HATLI|nr:arginine deiminase [Hathewaya limosa]MDQ0480382.1 arginine deiminase [Hathewaya limosa]
MSKNNVLNVTSEIGKLKTVLLHRPGEEIENLTPDLLERLLFDDIPFLKIAREEHDAFAKILQDQGVEVLYLEKLAAEALADKNIKDKFISQFIDEANVQGENLKQYLTEYFLSFDNQAMIDKMMAGVRKIELKDYKSNSLTDQADSYPFICDPMPNLYFTRDPFATIGHGITLNHMRTETRNRETIFAKYIFENHPRFKDENVPFWFNRDENSSLEGGDELILSDKILAIGISQRTDAASVEKLAKRLLLSEDTTFETILAFQIPVSRAFMHLDTVFTQVDYDKFTVHPGIEGPLNVYAITKDKNDSSKIAVTKEVDVLENILSKYLDRKITLIRCGGGDEIISAREQWNDGSNTLAIAPGEVVVYSRNYVTNKILEEYGIKIHVMPSSELSRGRGGPRCMSMPLIRENLK